MKDRRKKRAALPDLESARIAVIGLGYVGLPLAVEFAKHFDTVGFDINPDRVDELRSGTDSTLEVSAEELAGANRLGFSSSPESIDDCDVYIITVPTPIDRAKRPDLRALIAASELVGQSLASGNVVIFESTVYPGATEDDCAPVLERQSGLKRNEDFYLGYSPERINPGDKKHRISDIRKVTSGSTPDAAEFVDRIYSKVIQAGTFAASSIRVAEAAKVIENTQRDVNIALVNELAVIFRRLGLDTAEVLEAAGTKWNFLPFRPGLVGGHCIGVDPYYLTHKSQEVGYHPAMILAGRQVNDNMGLYVASEVVKLMITRGISIPGSRILVMGMTFKEDCPDVRNTKVIDVVAELSGFGATVEVFDPWADVDEVREEYGVNLLRDWPEPGRYDCIIVAVAHRQFAEKTAAEIRQLGCLNHVLFDVKSLYPADEVDGRL